jgi:hypothetical protein
MTRRQCAKRIQLTDTNLSTLISIGGNSAHNFSGTSKKPLRIHNLEIFCDGENDGARVRIQTRCSLNEQGNNSHAGDLDGGTNRIRRQRTLQDGDNIHYHGLDFTHDDDRVFIDVKLMGNTANGMPYLNISWTADFED